MTLVSKSMKKKKVFIITLLPMVLPLDEGVKNIVYEVVRGCPNIKFTLFTAKNDFSFSKENRNLKLVNLAFYYQKYHTSGIFHKFLIFLNSLFLRKNVDVVHLFFTPQIRFLGIFKKLFKGKKVVQTVTSVHNLIYKNKKFLGNGGKIKDLFFGDKVTVFSEYSKQFLMKKGVKNVECIYPAAREFSFSKQEFSDVRRKLDIEKEKIVLFPGDFNSLVSSDSENYLVDIIKKVSNESSNVKFILPFRIRNPEDIKHKKRFVEKLKLRNIENNVIILGTVDNFPRLLNVCDVCIFPTKKAAAARLEVPLALVEALSLGKPLIVSNIRPLDELIIKGIGVAVDYSVDKFSSIILKLLKNSNITNKFEKENNSFAKKRFNKNKMVKGFRQVYNSL